MYFASRYFTPKFFPALYWRGDENAGGDNGVDHKERHRTTQPNYEHEERDMLELLAMTIPHIL